MAIIVQCCHRRWTWKTMRYKRVKFGPSRSCRPTPIYIHYLGDFLWYIVFGNLPDLLTLFRASIVAISGLYAPPYEARVPLVAAQ